MASIPANQIELTLQPAALSANVNWYEGPSAGDYSEVVTAPPTVIQDDQPWRVELQNMTQAGAVFGALIGKWYFRVHFERIGINEGPGSLQTVFALNNTTPYVYPTQTINVPAGYLAPGLYEIYAELELVDTAGLVPMTGFIKLGNIKIVNA